MEFPLHIKEPLDMLITNDGDALTPIKIRARRCKKKPCERCGGPAAVFLSIGHSGCCFYEGYEHASGCPTIFCEHGIKRVEICHECDQEIRKEELETLYGRTGYHGFK